MVGGRTMTLYRAFLWTWIGGLVLFALVIALGLPLGITAVPGGILDHQAAGTAAEIDRIQRAWAEAGLLEQARLAMIGDLVFIGVYGVGSLLGGLYFNRVGSGGLKTLGRLIALAGVVFLITDYAETICQFIQLSRMAGDDTLAEIAATARPTKILAWLISFFGMLLALALTRKSRRSA